MVAKLASARHKPDKQTIVPWRAVPEMMRGMPLRSVRGLGGKLGEAVETVGGERLTMVSDLLVRPLLYHGKPFVLHPWCASTVDSAGPALYHLLAVFGD